MRWVLGVVAMLAVLQAMPAQAQLPCGTPLTRPCPQPTPVPTATPDPTVPVQITLRAKRGTLSWSDVGELTGRVTGPTALREALAAGRVELELTGRAEGYDRALEPVPVFPDANGNFTATDTTGVNSSFRVRATGDFSGVSNGIRLLRLPALQVRAAPVGRRLRIAFKATGPAHIATAGGHTPVTVGSAKRAFFYAGPGRRVPRIGSRPLQVRTRGGAQIASATLTVPFSRLPPGGGAAFACFRGSGFKGMQPYFRSCGARRAPLP